MRSAAIQTLNQVAVPSRPATCCGEGGLPSSQADSLPRIPSEFGQGGINRLGNRHRSVGDRLVFHAGNMA